MIKHNSLLYYLTFVIIFVSFSISASAADNNKKDKTVIATVADEQITFGDLMKAYKKNLNRKNVEIKDISSDSLLDFLNLFINYRLKVVDALKRGYESDSSVQTDLQQNRRILAENFYYDKKLIEPSIDRILSKRNIELQVAYVFIMNKTKGADVDTVEAFQKANEALSSIKGGMSFADAALKYSDDKESAKNGGILPVFITSGKLQRQIEDAIYSVKNIGDIYPELIRNRSGYFIIKLIRREPRVFIMARQIMLTEGLEKDTASVLKKADSLIKLLKKGADFYKLAEKTSDDAQTAMRGGSFGGYYSRSTGFETGSRNISPVIEDALFKLKDGEFSDKLISEFGVHILKRDSTRQYIPALERDEIKKMYKRLYYEDDKRDFLDSLKKLYGFEINQAALNELVASLDTTKGNMDIKWQEKVTDDIRNKDLFKFNKKTYSVRDLMALMNNKYEFKGFPLNEIGFKNAMYKIVEPIGFELATKNIENEYPEFSAQMKEFHDGILLFKVEAIEVWDKLKFDTVAAKKFFDARPGRYKTEPAYDFSEIYMLSDSAAKEAYHKVKSSLTEFDNYAAENTQRGGFKEKKGRWGLMNTKTNRLAKLIHEKAQGKDNLILEPLTFEKGFSVIKINKFEDVRLKTFEEAIPDFATEFQDMVQKNLTENWLNSIRTKYNVQINKDTLKKLISEK
ncbi:MAG: peptidylprolyl isomerase [Candidatus Kapabacteria bacterium]|nr:peptidylprolyl isomerase [Candidatus Kapabacteria bacterium]